MADNHSAGPGHMEVPLGTVRKAAEISYLSGPRWTSLPVLVLVTGGGMEYILYHLWMSRGPRDRPSAAEKKERQGCTGPVDRGKAVPATSADLVNRPQDFPLGSRGDGSRCSVLNFNVRTSLFVGPRLFVVFPQGVQGAPWRRHAQLPASDPCGRTCRNFATCRTTFSTVPSRPDAGPMAPWQEIPRTLPLSVPLGFQGSQPPPR